MKKCLLACLFGICFIPLFSQTIHTGSLSATDSTFNRPDEGAPPTTLSITGTAVSYDTFTVNIAVPSLVTFSTVSVWDNFIILYGTGGFNPLAPLENALVANDDENGPNAGFTYGFTAPGTYTVVICSYKNDVTGGYVVTTSAPIPLPLKLLSFTAVKASGNTNVVRWSTADESNLTAYQMQVSTDNKTFTDLKSGNIAAKNSSTVTSYSFTDNNPAAAYNYYRLKITERSGKIAYGPIALVKNMQTGLSNLQIFPNPSSDFIRIESKSMVNKKAFISIISTGGEILQSRQYSFSNQAVLSIDIKSLPAGKYFLKTTVDNDQRVSVFIKN
ncbi:MAG: T9SS type A sorting domain-containing protein [Ferruginibacter sp.]